VSGTPSRAEPDFVGPLGHIKAVFRCPSLRRDPEGLLIRHVSPPSRSNLLSCSLHDGRIQRSTSPTMSSRCLPGTSCDNLLGKTVETIKPPPVSYTETRQVVPSCCLFSSSSCLRSCTARTPNRCRPVTSLTAVSTSSIDLEVWTSNSPCCDRIAGCKLWALGSIESKRAVMSAFKLVRLLLCPVR